MLLNLRSCRKDHSPSVALPVHTFLVIATVLSLAAGFLPPASAAEISSSGTGTSALPEGSSAAPDHLPEELFEETIRTAYRLLSDYTAHSGSGIEFELGNIKTHGEHEFGLLRIIEIATLPQERVIDVARGTRSTSYPSGERRVSVHYRPEWRSMEADWRSNPRTVAGVEMDLREALPLLAQEDPIFHDLGAVTTYDVTATLEEESRSYRASFYWFKPTGQVGWNHFELLVVDHITQGVERALRETIPVDGIPAAGPGSESQSDLGNALATKASCISGTVASQSNPEQGQGTNSHLAGSHSASANFDFDCTCASDCTQTCQAGLSSPTCADGGITSDACHKMGFDDAAESSIVFGGGASCSAAFRCVQKACLFCQCGVSVSVSISGGKVTYSGDSGAWSFQRAWSMTCPSCPADVSIDDPIGGCSAGVINTTTSSLELTPERDLTTASSKSALSSSALGASRQRRGVVYPLYRVETRNGESFIMDEWAVTIDGAVVATSDPSFGEAVIEQAAWSAEGSSLVIQRPVHVMNARHVPEPGVLVNGSGLPKPLHGDGETVAARIEFGRNGRAESAELLFSSAPVDEEAIVSLLRRRVRVGFLGDKQHRAAAYVVVRLTDRVEILSAVSALPQCCCGTDEVFCA